MGIRLSTRRMFSYLGRFGWLGLILVAMAMVYLSPIDTTGADPKGTLLSAQTLIRHHTLCLDGYSPEILQAMPWQTSLYDGERYYIYPIGPVIISVPAVVVANLLGLDMRLSEDDSRLQRVLAGLCVGACAFLLWRLSRRILPTPWAYAVTGVLVFGTSIVSTLGTAFWNLDVLVVIKLILLILLFDRLRGDGCKSNSYLDGMLLALAFSCRPTSAIFIGLFLVVSFVHDRDHGFRVSLAALVGLGGLALASLALFGDLLPPCYLQSFGINGFSSEGLIGLLVSPGRGLFVFSPVFIMTLVTCVTRARFLRPRSLVILCGISFIGQVLVISQWPMWWGGHSFGSRLLADAIPELSMLTVLGTQSVLAMGSKHARFWCRSGWVALGALSIFVNVVQGLFNTYPRQCNIEPNVDAYPEVLFDWRHPIVLANPLWQDVRVASLRSRIAREESAEVLELVKVNSANIHLRTGFSVIESTSDGAFAWTDGKQAEATVIFDALGERNSDQAYFFGIEGFTYQRQEIEIFLAGERLGVINDSATFRTRKYFFPVSPSQQRQLQSGEVTVVFHISRPVRAGDRAMSFDSREIAFGLKGFELRQVK